MRDRYCNLEMTCNNRNMEKKRAKKTPDPNVMAFNILKDLLSRLEPGAIASRSPAETVATSKNPAAVALGRLGGLKGGPARAKKLSKKKLSAIGKKAAAARWSNRSRG